MSFSRDCLQLHLHKIEKYPFWNHKNLWILINYLWYSVFSKTKWKQTERSFFLFIICSVRIVENFLWWLFSAGKYNGKMHQHIWQVTSTHLCIQSSFGLWEKIPSMNLIASKCCYVTPNQWTSILPLKMRSLIVSAVELTHWKRLWCWEALGAGGEGDDRGWDGWMASLTRWTWVWVNSGRWWWTERPGVLWFMGSQRVRHDWATELNWIRYTYII